MAVQGGAAAEEPRARPAAAQHGQQPADAPQDRAVSQAQAGGQPWLPRGGNSRAHALHPGGSPRLRRAPPHMPSRCASALFATWLESQLRCSSSGFQCTERLHCHGVHSAHAHLSAAPGTHMAQPHDLLPLYLTRMPTRDPAIAPLSPRKPVVAP